MNTYQDMPYKKRLEAYSIILDMKAPRHQVVKAIEEMSELITALSKYIATNENLNWYTDESCSYNNLLCDKNIAEEIADVTIMLEQLRLIYGCNDRVKETMKRKIERTLRRLETGKE